MNVRSKRMERSLAVAVVFLVVIFAAQWMIAQQGMGSNAGPQQKEMAAKLEHFSQELQLTPQQKMQVAPILKQELPQLEQVKNNTSLGPLQKAMQLKQISTTTDSKIMPILNPQQQQKFQAMREQERQQMMQKLENRQQ